MYHQFISILASFAIGLSLGAGGTAIGNNWWSSYDNAAGKGHIGLWNYCSQTAVTAEDCKMTWNIQSIKDSPFFLGAIAAWAGGLVFMIMAQILWIVVMCTKADSRCLMSLTIGFTILAFAAWLATVLVWWLRLLNNDDAIPNRDNMDMDWTYWVAVGATALSLFAAIFTSIAACTTTRSTRSRRVVY